MEAKAVYINTYIFQVINYGRIYGAGLRFIQRLLQQYNPKLSDEETKRKAEHLFAVTKGEKAWYLSEAGEQLAIEMGHPVPEEPLPRKKVMLTLAFGVICHN